MPAARATRRRRGAQARGAPAMGRNAAAADTVAAVNASVTIDDAPGTTSDPNGASPRVRGRRGARGGAAAALTAETVPTHAGAPLLSTGTAAVSSSPAGSPVTRGAAAALPSPLAPAAAADSLSVAAAAGYDIPSTGHHDQEVPTQLAAERAALHDGERLPPAAAADAQSASLLASLMSVQEQGGMSAMQQTTGVAATEGQTLQVKRRVVRGPRQGPAATAACTADAQGELMETGEQAVAAQAARKARAAPTFSGTPGVRWRGYALGGPVMGVWETRLHFRGRSYYVGSFADYPAARDAKNVAQANLQAGRPMREGVQNALSADAGESAEKALLEVGDGTGSRRHRRMERGKRSRGARPRLNKTASEEDGDESDIMSEEQDSDERGVTLSRDTRPDGRPVRRIKRAHMDAAYTGAVAAMEVDEHKSDDAPLHVARATVRPRARRLREAGNTASTASASIPMAVAPPAPTAPTAYWPPMVGMMPGGTTGMNVQMQADAWMQAMHAATSAGGASAGGTGMTHVLMPVPIATHATGFPAGGYALMNAGGMMFAMPQMYMPLPSSSPPAAEAATTMTAAATLTAQTGSLPFTLPFQMLPFVLPQGAVQVMSAPPAPAAPAAPHASSDLDGSV